ncbi:MAG TPA: flagellar export chaperone FlgN [Bacillota bacterium]|nr:flagellar export chaperone FlgN [Bacillota bacterium]
MVDNTIVELMSLLEKKQLLFDRIMEITLEQKKVLEENEADKIESLVGRKQSVIDSIDEIDMSFSQGLKTLKKHLNVQVLEEVDFTKYPELKDLKLKVEEIMSMAQEIMLIERSNKEKLVSIMNEMKKEIKQIKAGKKSIKAYERPITNNDGIYVDKKK